MEEMIPITLFLCIAAVAILRPITKRVGGLLEAMTRERSPARKEDAVSARTVALLEQVGRRLDLIEERLDFTERLVATRNGDHLRLRSHTFETGEPLAR